MQKGSTDALNLPNDRWTKEFNLELVILQF